MNTTDRQPPQVRETCPELQNKTARDIQRDIDLMRLAYKYRIDDESRGLMVGWCLLALALAVPAIAILALIIL